MNIITLENNKRAGLGYDLNNCNYLVLDKKHYTLSIVDDIFMAVELFYIISEGSVKND